MTYFMTSIIVHEPHSCDIGHTMQMPIKCIILLNCELHS